MALLTAPNRDPVISPPARTRDKRKRARGDGKAAFVFLSPWIAGILLITIGPMLASLYLSFTDYNLIQAPNWVGGENYLAMLTDSRLANSLVVTLVYVLTSVPLQ